MYDDGEESGDGYTRTSSGFTELYNRPYAPELKWLDTFFLSTLGFYLGAIFNGDSEKMGINYVRQGSASNQRIGSKFTIWRLLMRVTFYTDPLVLDIADYSSFVYPKALRLMLVLDKQANGLLPTLDDILSTVGVDVVGAGFVEGERFNAYMNADNKDRFVLLHDKTLILTQSISMTATDFMMSGDQKLYEIEIDFDDGLEIEMSGIEGNLANVKSNNLIFLYVPDYPEITNRDHVSWSSRIFFTDY